MEKENKEDLISEDFRELFGDEYADEIEEYLRSYPFKMLSEVKLKEHKDNANV